MTMDLFIALPIPLEIAQYLHDRVEPTVSGCKLSNPEDMHITLRYLGEEDPQVISERLASVRYGSFTLPLDRLGRFERHLWAGVDDAGRTLARLKEEVDIHLGEIATAEPFGFNPHITIAQGEFTLPEVPLKSLEIPFTSFALYQVCSDGRFKIVQSFPFFESLRIAWVNDFHAELANAPRLVHQLKRFKKQNPSSMVLFGGDNYFGNPISEFLNGEPVTHIMQSLAVKYSALGNHDYEYGKETLRSWQKSGSYDFLCANIENHSELCKAWELVEINGKSIALLGLTTLDDMPSPETDPGMKEYPLLNSTEIAQKTIAEIRTRNVDAIIALTHIGLKETDDGTLVGPEAIELCETCPELDGVFTAHWHRFIKQRINGIAVAQGGGNGNGFAILDLVFTEEVRPTVLADFVQIDHNQEEDQETKTYLQKAKDRTWGELGATVGILAQAIPNKSITNSIIEMSGSPFSNFVVNLLLAEIPCDGLLLYSGRLGLGFPAGNLSRYDFDRTLMFNNTLYRLEITGEQLRKNINLGMRTLHADGSSPMAIGGFSLRIDANMPLGKRVLSIHDRHGKPLDDQKVYTIIIDDFMQLGMMGYDFSGTTQSVVTGGDMKERILQFLLDRTYIDEAIIKQLGHEWVRNVEDEDAGCI